MSKEKKTYTLLEHLDNVYACGCCSSQKSYEYLQEVLAQLEQQNQPTPAETFKKKMDGYSQQLKEITEKYKKLTSELTGASVPVPGPFWKYFVFGLLWPLIPIGALYMMIIGEW